MNVIKYNVNSGDVCWIGRQYEYGKTQVIFEGYQVIDSANEIYFKFVGRTEDSKYLIPIVDMTLDITQQLTKHVGQFSCQLEEMNTEGTLVSQSPVFYVAVKRSIKVGADYEVQDSRLETIYQKYNQMYNTISQTNETSLANESQRQAEWLTLKQEVSDAIDSFDADIAIGEFRTLVQTETDNFNTNAETKFNAYNQNDSQKTTAYNTNATEKLNAYNSNAENKVSEFNAQTEQIQTDISELKSDLSELGDTIGFAKSYNADVLASTAESTTTYLDVDISPQKQYNMTISVKSGTIEYNRPIFVNVYYSDESYASGKYKIYKDTVYSFVEEKQVVKLSIWIDNAPNEAELLFSLEPISKFENIKKYVDDNIYNVLHGKKLYCGGDSITEAVNVGSFDNGYKKSYGGIVAYRNKMEYVSDGVGGSTIGLCKVNGRYTNNFIQSRYKNIPTDADYITLWFGWNDNAYGWQSKRDEYCVSNYGTYYSALTDEQKTEVDSTNWRTWLNQYIADKDSTDITTWCGAWNTVLDWILENCPNAHVGVCIGYGVDNSFKQPIIDVCKSHGVPYLKCYDSNDCFSVGHSDGISSSVATQRKSLYTLDNTHPNELGYEMISTSYEQFLKRI